MNRLGWRGMSEYPPHCGLFQLRTPILAYPKERYEYDENGQVYRVDGYEVSFPGVRGCIWIERKTFEEHYDQPN
jgi:hypothetical protein